MRGCVSGMPDDEQHKRQRRPRNVRRQGNSAKAKKSPVPQDDGREVLFGHHPCVIALQSASRKAHAALCLEGGASDNATEVARLAEAKGVPVNYVR